MVTKSVSNEEKQGSLNLLMAAANVATVAFALFVAGGRLLPHVEGWLKAIGLSQQRTQQPSVWIEFAAGVVSAVAGIILIRILRK